MAFPLPSSSINPGPLSVDGGSAATERIELGADVVLYRSGANQLKTDDAFTSTQDLIARNGNTRLSDGTWAGAGALGPAIACGNGAPVNASGINGDIYLRADGGALTTIYQRRAGVWIGVA